MGRCGQECAARSAEEAEVGQELAGCFDGADEVFFFQPANIGWDLGEVTAHMSRPAQVFDDLEALINRLVAESRAGDHILIMSNGGFDGIHDKLIARLKQGTS